MVLYVISNLWANVLNFVVFVIKAFAVNLKFGLYVRLLSIKVYITVFARELIKIVYFSLVFCVYNVCI
jgi:hypothetical protein